ncbi:unnamed protein product [[Candida] boidinii]|nr:unnamed protein product [[Candida] boidinii]GMF64673.1 unnamed protein product [[Candida] boidinii]
MERAKMSAVFISLSDSGMPDCGRAAEHASVARLLASAGELGWAARERINNPSPASAFPDEIDAETN